MDDGRLRRKDEIREESDILKQLLWHITNGYEQGLNKVTLNRRNPWSELGPLCFLPNQLVDFVTRAFKIPPRKTLKCAIFYESFTNVSTLAIPQPISQLHSSTPGVSLCRAVGEVLWRCGQRPASRSRIQVSARRSATPTSSSFPSASPGKFRFSTINYDTTIPSTSFPIHHSPNTLYHSKLFRPNC